MLTGKTSRVLVAGAAVLCLAACTGNSTTASSSSSTASSAAGANASTSPPSAVSSSTGSEGLTSVPGLPQEALDVMNQPQYALGQWAISVRDIDTGEQIVSLHPDTLFEPASVTKTYSTGAAWLELGPDSTVTTPVKRTGEVAGGTLTGISSWSARAISRWAAAPSPTARSTSPTSTTTTPTASPAPP